MEINLEHCILAAVTINKDTVGGGMPIFYVDNLEELERIAMVLSRVTAGMAHDLGNGTYIIVKH